MLRQNLFEGVDLSLLRNLAQINMMITVPEIVLQKLILSIRKNYMNCTKIIILQLQRKQKSKNKCSLIINQKLLMTITFLFVMLKNQFLTSFAKKGTCFIQKLATFFKTRIKITKVCRALQFDQSKLLKPYSEFNTRKRIEAENNGDKRWKSILQISEQCCTW